MTGPETNDASLLVTTEGATQILTLNRPEVRNAIDGELRARFVDELQRSDASSAVRVVVITGTDPAFCAGVDIKSPVVAPTAGPNPGAALRAVRTPVIAAVNGACVTGGLEIALSCDFIVASDRASFADTHAQRGRVPSSRTWGMTTLLPEAVGLRLAKELSLTGRFLSAEEARDVGLVNHVVHHDDLLSCALGAAEAIAASPADAVAAWLDVYDGGPVAP
jgi:enoyl-CoA hydratase